MQEQPPGFIGKIIGNTTARYNAFYNSNKLYTESLISGEDSYQEDYTETMPVSVQDAVAKSGAMTGEMDVIIKKTTRVINKRPYSKWVDDNYLLNGIAHYVKGDYEKAIDIFTFTASEYKNGVEYERVGARQRIKAVNIEKLKKEKAKKILAEREREQKRLEKERKQKIKDRKREVKEKRKRKQEEYLTKDEQFKLKQQAKREGRDLTTEELLEEIREEQKQRDKEDQEVSENDLALIANAPTLKNDNKDNPGFLSHPLAAKDAMLWLAKTYITTEKFIAAQAVLTAINEDPGFPQRLNESYYLTYADMHIRLNNLPKAAEYVLLAIEEAKNRDKGRLYYVLGQIYTTNKQTELAKQAFSMVEKYHPDYNMIYHANMRLIRKDYLEGKFSEKDYTETLKKMSRDAKNEEFFGEVFYYLGNAYKASGEDEKAVKAFNRSLASQESKPFTFGKTYFSLADHYYQNGLYEKAQSNFQFASEEMGDESGIKKQQAELYANSLKSIVSEYKAIQLQDSLLRLSTLPRAELTIFLQEKVKKELKEQLREKLEVKNSEFGSGSNTISRNRRQNRRNNLNNRNNSGIFYFYDVQQTSQGFTEFKSRWGNRPNTDNWRRSAAGFSGSAIAKRSATPATSLESGSPDAMLAQYLSEIPLTENEKHLANLTIQNAYLKIGEVFVEILGEFEKGKQVLKELLTTRNPEPNQRKKAEEILHLANMMQYNTGFVEYTTENDNASNKEIDKLYSLAYSAFEEENFENVLSIYEQAKSFQNNAYKDKFAFMYAISKGQTESDRKTIQYLQEFIQAYPESPLVEKAISIIE